MQKKVFVFEMQGVTTGYIKTDGNSRSGRMRTSMVLRIMHPMVGFFKKSIELKGESATAFLNKCNAAVPCQSLNFKIYI